MSKRRDKLRGSFRKERNRYKISIPLKLDNQNSLYNNTSLDKGSTILHQIASEITLSLVSCKRKMDSVLKHSPEIHKYI